MASFLEEERMEKLWDAWNIRVMILCSLTLQIILIALGERRKNIRGAWIQILVWCAYMMADPVAILTLSRLSQAASQTNSHCITRKYDDPALRVLWAPLLLGHLAGPDTIATFNMEDSKLWGRHLLGLVVRLSIAIYVFYMWYWTIAGTRLSILIIVLFISGTIKNGERTWVIMNARKAVVCLISDNDLVLFNRNKIKQDPNASLIMNSYVSFQNKRHIAFRGERYTDTSPPREFVDYLLKDANCLFKFVELELGFLYDVLYTKAAIVCTRFGCAVRSLSFICTVTVLVGFLTMAKDDNSHADVVITYILLAGAVVLEVYGMALIVYSNWGILWMIKHRKNSLVAVILPPLAHESVNRRKRWCNSVAQFNVISFCIEEDKQLMVMLRGILKLCAMDQKFKKWRHHSHVNSDQLSALRDLMAEEWGSRIVGGRLIESKLGERALERYGCHTDQQLRGTIIDRKEFDEIIIIWHIATDICFHSTTHPNVVDEDARRKTSSKLVSNYMMYLLVFRLLHQVQDHPLKHSALDNSIKLAKILMDNYSDKVWKIIFGVWMEMLCHAAYQCHVDHHAELLRLGGELLNQVRVLLSHANFSENGTDAGDIESLIVTVVALPGVF